MTHSGGHTMHPIHHKRADGGGVSENLGEGHEDDRKDKGKMEKYSGGDSDTAKEAERKRGGKRANGGKAPALAVGGAVARAMRMDRRGGRKRGGSVGADMHPLTTASKMTEAEGEKSSYKSLDSEDD